MLTSIKSPIILRVDNAIFYEYVFFWFKKFIYQKNINVKFCIE